MEELKEMCTIRQPYKCTKCGQEMLFFITRNKKLIDYKRLFERYGGSAIELKKALIPHDVTYLKCLCCNQIFVIDWTTGCPTQVTDKKIIDKFMRKPM